MKVLRLEALEERFVPATVALDANGLLSVVGATILVQPAGGANPGHCGWADDQL